MTIYTASSITRRQPITWSQAAKEYFLANPKHQAKWAALLPRLLPVLVRVFPPLSSFIIVADDATVVGVMDDWMLLLTFPLLLWNLRGIKRIRNASRP